MKILLTSHERKRYCDLPPGTFFKTSSGDVACRTSLSIHGYSHAALSIIFNKKTDLGQKYNAGYSESGNNWEAEVEVICCPEFSMG